ncbi:putative Type 1 protein exporter [Helianthus annuus]|nr:putative Type 1 protein exporter [Helianthus annuus]
MFVLLSTDRLCILIQDFCAAFAAIVIGFSLEWRLALSLRLPYHFLSSLQLHREGISGFSRGIEELHKKASVVLEDLVKNISIVMAYCAGNEVSRVYSLYLKKFTNKLYSMGC